MNTELLSAVDVEKNFNFSPDFKPQTSIDSLSAWLYDQGLQDLYHKASAVCEEAHLIFQEDENGDPTTSAVKAFSRISSLESSLTIFSLIKQNIELLEKQESH